MKKTLAITITVVLLLLIPLPGFCGDNLLPHLTQGNFFSPAVVPTVCVIRDSTELYWTIFSSDFFGFHEFWVAYSRDTQNWSRPLYTAIPVLPSNNYQIKVTKHNVDIDWHGELDNLSEPNYYRAHIDTMDKGYTIAKQTLYTLTHKKKLY